MHRVQAVIFLQCPSSRASSGVSSPVSFLASRQTHRRGDLLHRLPRQSQRRLLPWWQISCKTKSSFWNLFVIDLRHLRKITFYKIATKSQVLRDISLRTWQILNINKRSNFGNGHCLLSWSRIWIWTSIREITMPICAQISHSNLQSRSGTSKSRHLHNWSKLINFEKWSQT